MYSAICVALLLLKYVTVTSALVVYFRSVHVDYIYRDGQHIDMFVAHQEALLIMLYQVVLLSA